MQKSRIFLFLLLAFILGTGIGSFVAIPFFISFCILVTSIVFLVWTWFNPKLKLIGFCLIILVLGILRYNASLPKVDIENIQFYNGKEVVFQGIVSKEPDVRIDKTKLTINSQQLTVGDYQRKVQGRVLVTVPLYPGYDYGDKLEISCRLEQPKEFNNFDYPGYLACHGIYSLCYWSKINIISRDQGNRIYTAILSLKSKLQNIINSTLKEPQASLLSAMLLGNKRNLSPDFQEELNITGTRHLTAVSGLHVTVLAMIFMNIAVLFVRRQTAFYFAIAALVLFIILVGAPASAVRAGIMVFLLLLAQRLGRLKNATNAVVLAGVLMLLVNPKLLSSDVGFQLSFTAVLGIIWLYPHTKNFGVGIYPYWLKKFSWLSKSIAVTLAAQIFAFPLVWYHFGYLSLVAPLSNVFILPVMPFVLGLGFLFGLPSVIFSWLAKIFVWPVWLVLSYVAGAVKIFSKIPFASISTGHVPWWFVVFLYILIGCWVYNINQKNKYPIE